MKTNYLLLTNPEFYEITHSENKDWKFITEYSKCNKPGHTGGSGYYFRIFQNLIDNNYYKIKFKLNGMGWLPCAWEQSNDGISRVAFKITKEECTRFLNNKPTKEDLIIINIKHTGRI